MAGCLKDLLKKTVTTVPWRFWQIKSQAKRRICWSPQIRNRLRSSLLACFWISAGRSNLLHRTGCASFTLHVPHHKLILLYGNTGGTANKHYKTVWTAFLFVQHSHSTPNQRKQPPKHISGGLNEYVRGWVGG